jgi:hypothetical protein
MSLVATLKQKIEYAKLYYYTLRQYGSVLFDRRGEPEGLSGMIVALAVALLIAGVLLPVALNQIYSANTTSWNQAVAIVFSVLLPILEIIAIALTFFRKVRV